MGGRGEKPVPVKTLNGRDAWYREDKLLPLRRLWRPVSCPNSGTAYIYVGQLGEQKAPHLDIVRRRLAAAPAATTGIGATAAAA
jgi:hypothetical protein